MRLLLDTHLLLWAVGAPERLSPKAQNLLFDTQHHLIFSVVGIWEVAIKRALGKSGFLTDPERLRSVLLDNGFSELTIESRHVILVADIPMLHKDPFDRLLIAQARSERLPLVTSDLMLARYPGDIVLV